MKKLSIYSIILSAVLFTGCKIDWGQSFHPTELGYDMTTTTISEMQYVINKVHTMRHLDEYIAADADERVAIQDRFFYSQRIVERESGEWHIIVSDSETFVVFTGGKSIGTAGTRWSFCNFHQEYDKDNLPWIENASDGEHTKFLIHHTPRSGNDEVLDMAVSFVPYEQISGGETTAKEHTDIEAADGIMRCTRHYYFNDDIMFRLHLESTLRYDDKEGVSYGSLAFSSDIAGTPYTARAEFKESHLTVWSGKDNAYKEDYRFPPHYWE